MPTIELNTNSSKVIALDDGAANYYPTSGIDPTTVDLYWHYPDEDPRAARFIGRAAIGENIIVPYNPVVDADPIVLAVPVAPDGLRAVSDLRDAQRLIIAFKREVAAPTVTQIGNATPSVIQLGISDFTEFARKRRIRIADNAGMSSPTVIVYDSSNQLMPRFVDIMRNPTLQALFTWSGNDPAANGFTKVGSGTTAADGGAWKITTTGSDAATNYTKNSPPSSPFANGATLEVQPPVVASTEGDFAVAVRWDSGSKKYELTFTATQVKLNGGTAHTHGGARVRLVINAGGNAADLWIGTTKVEDETSGLTGSANELRFGDLATTDDAEASWSFLAYALTSQEPLLAQTIYVRVSHDSGTGWSAESAAQSFTFANETGGGGSAGTTDDPFYFLRQEVDLGV